MIKSNVTVRSNVFVRRATELGADPAFVAQVRGRSALESLLQRLQPWGDRVDAARKHFTHEQLSQRAWQARCGTCGAFPEGPVLANGALEVQFRCPRHTCRTLRYSARTILIDVELIRRCDEILKQPFEVIVQEALKHPVAQLGAAQRPAADRRPVTVRMTLTQKYVFTDALVEDAVRRLLASQATG
jgi:hypothetical protein